MKNTIIIVKNVDVVFIQIWFILINVIMQSSEERMDYEVKRLKAIYYAEIIAFVSLAHFKISFSSNGFNVCISITRAVILSFFSVF